MHLEILLKEAQKRELGIEDLLRDDQPVKFDTGLPNCVCLDVIMNLTLPTQKKFNRGTRGQILLSG